MKIFISYRRKDSAREVGRLRDRLKAEFGDQSVFRDLTDIPPGADFRDILGRETNGCDVMLVVIGPLWAGITDAREQKRLFDPLDFTRIEVETGIRRLEEDGITVIPVLVLNAIMPSAVDLPESLGRLTYQNAISVHDDPYFDFDMEQLIRAIKASKGYTDKDISTDPYEPKTVYIAEGPFLMGCQPGLGIPAYEAPQHEVTLPAYRIGQFPVKNHEYEEFTRQTKMHVRVPSMYWEGQRVQPGFEDYPVSGVTWFEALAYCQWLSETTGRKYTLPNEAQWEKACRGGNRFLYPWGDELEPDRSNQGCEVLAPVNAYPVQNDFGCFDFVGNVRQWTCTLWGEKRVQPDPRFAYPWEEDRRNDLSASRQIRRVVRGSSFKDKPTLLRCSARSGQVPDDPGLSDARHSFRVLLNV